MTPKRRAGLWSELVYVELLSGPGWGIDRASGEEFSGSPLRALGVTPGFDRLFFSDLEPANVRALNQRIRQEDRSRVVLRPGDCHEIAAGIVPRLPRKALGVAFVDSEGFEVGFRLFESLALRSIDILYLFPGGIGVARNLPAFARRKGVPLDDLLPEWRTLRRDRLAAGGPLSAADVAIRDQPFVLAFRSRMSTLGYRSSDQAVRLRNRKNVTMYHLLFFSKDVAGLKIWEGVTKIGEGDQRRLL